MDYRRLIGTLLAITLSACAGKEGPTGPRGPRGEPGPGTRLMLTATINSNGGASVAFPKEAGSTFNDPPALTCYMSDPGNNVWLQVADGDPYQTNTEACGLVFSNGVFNGVIANAIAGYTVAFVATY